MGIYVIKHMLVNIPDTMEPISDVGRSPPASSRSAGGDTPPGGWSTATCFKPKCVKPKNA